MRRVPRRRRLPRQPDVQSRSMRPAPLPASFRLMPSRFQNMLLSCGRFRLDLTSPRIMAIVNVTRDSFSGDGCGSIGDAVREAERAVEEGADLIDVGGESSRPGAQGVSEQEELDRVVPVVEALQGLGVPVSVDTVKPRVMQAVLAAGADLINDIAGFRTPGALDAVKDASAALCVMHMQGEPRTMQAEPSYGDVVEEVRAFLGDRVSVLRQAGVAAERIVLDPGFGFGKTLDHNLTLLAQLDVFCKSGYPVLVGMSRKSMLGTLTGRPVGERQVAGAVAAMLALERGASIVRTHDVAATRDVMRVFSGLEAAEFRLGRRADPND